MRYFIPLLLSTARATAGAAAGDALLLLPCGSGDPSLQSFSTAPSGVGVALALASSLTLVWDISGPSSAPGTPLHVWGRYTPAVPNQQWVFSGSSLASLFSAALCVGASSVDPATRAPTFGSPLAVFPCNASDASQRLLLNGSAVVASGAAPAPLCATVVHGEAPPACGAPPFSSYPYCNASLPVSARVADLVARMTTSEKALAMTADVPAIPRLGVPTMHAGEALHGAATGCLASPAPGSTGCPTSFPAAIAMGASFDRELWEAVGTAIGTEARALYNEGAGAAWVFTPNLNPVRDPRWGRAQEVPGEDPLLVSSYGFSYVRGLQGGAPPTGGSCSVLAAATLKHWVAYDLEGFMPRTDPLPRPPSARCDCEGCGGCQRWNFNALVNDRDLHGYYAAPFVGTEARSIMCAYSGVGGFPACGSPLLNDLLRGGGWDGHVVSDCTAIELMQNAKWDGCKDTPPTTCKPDWFPGHNFTHTVAETALVSLTSGTDNNCGPFYGTWLNYLVQNGSVPEALLDTAVTRVYRTALLLGLLDAACPFWALNRTSVDTPAHRALALRAARESLVLLKNNGALLPLSASTKLAFIGPYANATQQFLSNYHGDNLLVNSGSPLQTALARNLPVTYARGCNICDEVPSGFPNMPCTKSGDASGIPAAAAAAAAADVAVLFVGLDQTSEAENFDRNGLGLPGAQDALIAAVVAANPRTVLVVVGGGPVSAPLAYSAAASVLHAGYGGQAGGAAIVDALTGATSPAGKLPFTIYYNSITARDIRDVDLAHNGGITHMYFEGPVVFPFGAGLTGYTRFAFSVVAPAAGAAATPLRVSRAQLRRAVARTPFPVGALTVRVKNVGPVVGDAVVLVMVRRRWGPRAPSATAPVQALVDFTRVRTVAPGEEVVHTFELTMGVVLGAFRGEQGAYDAPVGEYELLVEGNVALSFNVAA